MKATLEKWEDDREAIRQGDCDGESDLMAAECYDALQAAVAEDAALAMLLMAKKARIEELEAEVERLREALEAQLRIQAGKEAPYTWAMHQVFAKWDEASGPKAAEDD
jgi:dihydropteroate synthase